MKKILFLLAVTVVGVQGNSLMAQFSGLVKKTDTTRNKVTPATTTNKIGVTQPPANGAAATTNAAVANAAGDAKPGKVVDTSSAGGFGQTVPKSLRNGTAVERTITREKKPLEYEHLREDDWHFSEMIWREIDAREKINQSFVYQGKDDNGDQRFFSILLSAINNDSVVAFSAEDDRFTKPLANEEISRMLKGSLDTQLVQSATNPNIMDTAIIYNTNYAPNPDSIYTYRLKEQVIFDKEASRWFVRIIGIAPVAKMVINGKSVPKTLFWIYYPDLRKTLTKFLVYNPKSFASRMTWEDLFESRYFSSYIVKTSNNNPQDKFLSGLIKDPLFRLLEGDNIKERLFNYEQDLWSY